MTKPCFKCGTEIEIPAAAADLALVFEMVCTPCTGITVEELEAMLDEEDDEDFEEVMA